jgi:hypothetical protein
LSLNRYAKKDYQRIAVVFFLFAGILSLAWSIYLNNTVLALVGIGLTFWGVLFLLLGPLRAVEDGLLYDTATSEYSTINRIINDLKCTGDAFYMPPIPKGLHVTGNPKGLKDVVVFISPRRTDINLPTLKERSIDLPTSEERGEGKFLLKDRKGLLLTPPGLGILKDIEKRLKTDFSEMEVMQFCQVISDVLLEKFNLAKEIETIRETNVVKFRIRHSAYENLYTRDDNLTTIHLLGCPLASAIAVGLAKASKRNVGIVNENVSRENSVLEVWFRIYH